jgi:translation elongation factor EF-Tu-like GTPase
MGPDGCTTLENYLGICFTGNGDPLMPGKSHEVALLLVYHPEVNYEPLATGATFTIREGDRIVGFGVVTEGYVAT